MRDIVPVRVDCFGGSNSDRIGKALADKFDYCCCERSVQEIGIANIIVEISENGAFECISSTTSDSPSALCSQATLARTLIVRVPSSDTSPSAWLESFPGVFLLNTLLYVLLLP